MAVDRTIGLIGGVAGYEDATVAAIADETGRVVGRASGPPADLIGTVDACGQHDGTIARTLGAARAAAGVVGESLLAALVVGITGYDEGLTPPAVVDGISLCVAVLPYTDIAHAGALGGQPGIVVVADARGAALGTAAGVADYMRAGGWGFPFASDGGALSIGMAAVQSAMQAADHGEPSRMGDAALTFFAVPSLRALQHAYHRGEISARAIADFAHVALDLANRIEGFPGAMDRDALYLRMHAARMLSGLAMRVEAGLPACTQRAFSYGGSLFTDAGMCDKFGEMLGMDRWFAEIRSERERSGLPVVGKGSHISLNPMRLPPRLRPLPPLGDALDGAMILARRLARAKTSKTRFTSSEVANLN